MGIELEIKGRHHHLGEGEMKRPDTPFPRHWFYYIVLKIVILIVAILLGWAYFQYWTPHGT